MVNRSTCVNSQKLSSIGEQAASTNCSLSELIHLVKLRSSSRRLLDEKSGYQNIISMSDKNIYNLLTIESIIKIKDANISSPLVL